MLILEVLYQLCYRISFETPRNYGEEPILYISWDIAFSMKQRVAVDVCIIGAVALD